MGRFMYIGVLAGLVAPLLMGAAGDTGQDLSPPPIAAWITEANSLIEGGKPAAAVALCKANGVSPETRSVEARTACALAYTKVADRLHLIGLKSRARSFWLHASKLDLALLDDPDFMVRLTPEPAPSPTPVPVPAPQPTTQMQPLMARSAVFAEPIERAEPAETAVKVAPTPPGPRAHSDFYLGVGGGYDGVASVHMGWCHEERVLLETSVGLVFPVIDTRVRILGSRSELTPFVGVGITTPLARQDNLGMDLPTYKSLYALGQTLHADLGLAWAFSESLEAFGGLAFVTSLDENDPNQIIFFPQFALQLSYKL